MNKQVRCFENVPVFIYLATTPRNENRHEELTEIEECSSESLAFP
jgi:hypothetical protein